MHLYDNEGNPVYEVPYANPKKGMRAATLRDAKKMDLLPSVTEILRILDKPGLNQWKEKNVFWAAKTSVQGETESDEDYFKRTMKDSQEEARVKRDEGSAIHNAIESAFKDRIIDRQYETIALYAKAQIEQYFDCYTLDSERTFARNNVGYGGKIDLSSTQYKIIADIKTKEEIEPGKRLAWDEHLMQLVAYARGLSLHYIDTRLVNIFVSWSGEIIFHEWENRDEKTRAWLMFKAALDLWKHQKRYYPGEITEAA